MSGLVHTKTLPPTYTGPLTTHQALGLTQSLGHLCNAYPKPHGVVCGESGGRMEEAAVF